MSHRSTVAARPRPELGTRCQTKPPLKELRNRDSRKTRSLSDTLMRQRWLLVRIDVKRHVRNVLRHVRVNLVTVLIHQRRHASLFTRLVLETLLLHVFTY